MLGNTDRVAGDDKENPVISSVKARLKNPEKPFTRVVTVRVREGAGERFEAAFAKAITATRKERGNLAYDLNRDTQNPSHYLVYERWKDLAALEAHLKTPHLKTLFAELPKMTDGGLESQVLVPTGE